MPWRPVSGERRGVVAGAARGLLGARRRSGESLLVRAMPLPASRGWALLGVCVAAALTTRGMR